MNPEFTRRTTPPVLGRAGSTTVTGGVVDEQARAEHARRMAGDHLDTTRLNRLCELTARLLSTGSAQISIVSDVLTVVGGAGASLPLVGTSSPASDSLCAVTMRSGTGLVVRNAAVDPLVSGLPPVVSGTVRSYLGVPLASGGHVVGALCAYGDDTRDWDETELSLLSLLAEAVTSELHLAVLEASYAEDRRIWQLAVDAGGVGAFDWDLTTGELRWDERLLALFGIDRESFGGTIEAFNEFVHPEDRERVAQALRGAVDTVGAFAAEYRIVLPDGRVRWVSARGQAYGEGGTATQLVGAAFDTTLVQEGEARVARILEAMPSAFFQLDDEWRFTYANAEADKILAPIGSGVVGEIIWELFPDAVGSPFEDNYRQAVRTGQPVQFEAYYPPPLDSWYEIRAWPTPDELSVYFLDVTERRRAQASLARSMERAALLAQVSDSLSDSFDTMQAVGRLAQLMVPRLAQWCLITLVDDADPLSDRNWRRHLRDIGYWHATEEGRAVVQAYGQDRIAALTDDSFVAQVLRTNAPVHVAANATPLVAAVLVEGPARDHYLTLAPESVLVLPVRGRGRTVGILTLGRDAGQGPFTAEEIGTLEEAAARAGLALDNARLYAEQRELAEGLQRSLLTAPPVQEGLQVAVRYEPAAEIAQVGGDWYDAFHQADGSTVVVIGDVVGHDTDAAAAMGQLRAMLRGIAVTTGDGPAEVLRRLDHAMPVLELDTTATCVMARFDATPEDPGTGTTRMRWSNAGHPPPMVALTGPDGGVSVEPLWSSSPDLLLGLDLETERSETVVTLPPGAIVLLYSDGLVERRGQSLGDGIEELRRSLRDLVSSGLDLEAMCDALLDHLLPLRREDDVAMVAVQLDR